MRRKSTKTSKSSQHHDSLDDLETESIHRLGRPIPPIRLEPTKRHPQSADRRNWDPVEASPPRDFFGRTARISHQPKKANRVHRGPGGKPLQARQTVWSRLDNASPRFAEARKTVICFKRKARREVLHALKRTKAGSGSPKRRNEWSDVQC